MRNVLFKMNTFARWLHLIYGPDVTSSGKFNVLSHYQCRQNEIQPKYHHKNDYMKIVTQKQYMKNQCETFVNCVLNTPNINMLGVMYRTSPLDLCQK